LPTIPPYNRDMHRSAGVIAGECSTDVVLRFTPGVSSWIAEQEGKITFAGLVGHVLGDQASNNSFHKGHSPFAVRRINGTTMG
jgi:hypothetical protein